MITLSGSAFYSETRYALAHLFGRFPPQAGYSLYLCGMITLAGSPAPSALFFRRIPTHVPLSYWAHRINVASTHIRSERHSICFGIDMNEFLLFGIVRGRANIAGSRLVPYPVKISYPRFCASHD